MSDEGSSAPQPAAEQVEKKEEGSAPAPEKPTSDAAAPTKTESSAEETAVPASNGEPETKKSEADKEGTSTDAGEREASKEDNAGAGGSLAPTYVSLLPSFSFVSMLNY